ncbi:MAG: DUF3078 domain-containing protein [Bacteroidales bacterium]|jgi:hypothetical protein|nr:DUF3078 domain-containing protein [Bacteroidales bacterium]
MKYLTTSVLFFSLTMSVLGSSIEDKKVVLQQDETPAISEPIKGKWTLDGQFQVLLDHSYSLNWKGASYPHIGLATMNRMSLKFEKGKLAWENNLAVDLGFKCSFLPNVDPITKTKNRFEKTVDKIDFNSKFGYLAKGYWFYSGLFTWNTQMLKGYDYQADTMILSSAFMTKGTMTLSLGMDYKRKMWSWYISPLSATFIYKIHPDFRNRLEFGVDSGKWCYPTLGAMTSLVFNADVHPKINLFAKLELKMDYRGEFKQMRNVDASFEMKWLFSVTDWLAISLNAALLYDYDDKFDVYDANGVPTGEKVDHLQFRENIGISLGYKFSIPKAK